MSGDREYNYSNIMNQRISRRKALSTGAKIGLAAIGGVVVGAIGGYLGGTMAAPTSTATVTQRATETVTSTVGAATVTQTLTKTETVTKTETAVITSAYTVTGTTPAISPTTPLEEAIADIVAEVTGKRPTDTYKPFKGITLRGLLIGGGAYEALYEIIPTFEKVTGATVDSTTRLSHFELNKRLVIEAEAKSDKFDFFSDHTSFYAGWAEFHLPLNDYITNADKNDFLGKVFEACGYEGNILILPRHSDSRLVYYRTDLFGNEEMKARFKQQFGYDLEGPPQNWDQWFDMAKFFTNAPDIYGFVFTGKEEALTGTIYEATVAAGGNFFDENWNPIMNDEPGVKALTHYAKLYQEKTTPPGVPNYLWDEVNSLFRAGKVAFLFDWPGWYTLVKESDVGSKFDLAMYPKGPANNIAVWSGSHAFGVNKYGGNKEAAVALVKVLTSAPALYFEATKTGTIPTRRSSLQQFIKDAEKSPDPRDAKRLRILMDVMDKYYLPVPKTGQWSRISDAFWPEAQKAILGTESPKEALDAIAEKVRGIMREAGYYK
jgi:multiple sugar transport system substrate-binding protein